MQRAPNTRESDFWPMRLVALASYPLACLAGGVAGALVAWSAHDLWRFCLRSVVSPWPHGDPPITPLLGAATFRMYSYVMCIPRLPGGLCLLLSPSDDESLSAALGSTVDCWWGYLVVGSILAWLITHAAACSLLDRTSGACRTRSLRPDELLPPVRSTCEAAFRGAIRAGIIAVVVSEMLWLYPPTEMVLLPRTSMWAARIMELWASLGVHPALMFGAWILLPTLIGAAPGAWSLARVCSLRSRRARGPFCRSCGYTVFIGCPRCPECGQSTPSRRVRFPAWVPRPRGRVWTRRLAMVAIVGGVLVVVTETGGYPLWNALVSNSRWYREHWLRPADLGVMQPQLAPNREYNAVLLSGHAYRYADSCGEVLIHVEHRPLVSLTIDIHAADMNESSTFPLSNDLGSQTDPPDLRVGNRTLRIVPATRLLLNVPDKSMVLVRVYTPYDGAAIVSSPNPDGPPKTPAPP
jgi:hypothetical protein